MNIPKIVGKKTSLKSLHASAKYGDWDIHTQGHRQTQTTSLCTWPNLPISSLNFHFIISWCSGCPVHLCYFNAIKHLYCCFNAPLIHKTALKCRCGLHSINQNTWPLRYAQVFLPFTHIYYHIWANIRSAVLDCYFCCKVSTTSKDMNVDPSSPCQSL